MKKLLLLLFLVPKWLPAATLTIIPIDGQSVDFIDAHPDEGTGTQLNLFVVASGTKAWNINMKYDYFITQGSTIPIPYNDATYTILTTPCDNPVSHPLPWNLTTIYTANTAEYTTKGTTVTLNINVNPKKGIKLGNYHSNLHIELGDKL